MKEKTNFTSALSRNELIFGLVYLVFHVFLLPDLLYLLLSPVFGQEVMQGPWLTFAYYLVGAVAVLAAARRFMRASFDVLCDDPMRAVSSVAGGYLLYWVLLYAVSAIIYNLRPDLASNPNNDLVTQGYLQSRGVMLASAGILAPIAEEFLFRGVVFGSLRPRSRLAAYAVSAGVFALYHLWQYLFTGTEPLLFLLYLLQYLPGALALARCYERSRSIWPPIFLHMLINWIALTAE